MPGIGYGERIGPIGNARASQNLNAFRSRQHSRIKPQRASQFLIQFIRNDIFDASDALLGKVHPYKLNQFGGSIGGPIVKNRTFFFGDYEGYRSRQGRTFISSVPTVLMRNGNFSDLLLAENGAIQIKDPITGVPYPGNVVPQNPIPGQTGQDPVGSNILNLYPISNNPDPSLAANNYISSSSAQLNQDTFDVKIDDKLSDSSSIFGRYSFEQVSSLQPSAYPNTPWPWPTPARAASARGAVSPTCNLVEGAGLIGVNFRRKIMGTPLRATGAELLSVLSTSVTKQTGDMVYSGAQRLRRFSIWAHTTMLYALERDLYRGSTFAVPIELSEGRDVSSGPVSRLWNLASHRLPLDQPYNETGQKDS